MLWRPTIMDVIEEVPHCPACGGCAYHVSGRAGANERPADVTCKACNMDIMWFYRQRMDGFSQRMVSVGLMAVAILLIGVITLVKLNGAG